MADYRFRYFTPGHETPLCGHATIAAVSALMEGVHETGIQKLAIETGIGVIRVSWDFATREVTMEQGDAAFLEFEGNKEALLGALGLSIQDYDERYPIVYGSTGSWTTIVPIRSRECFGRMKPQTKEFPAILEQNSHASIHPMTMDCVDSHCFMHGRHFSSPYSGTIEDAVTGTASGVMGAYYLQYMCKKEKAEFYVEQGYEINREGSIHVFAKKNGHRIQVRIAGCAVKMDA